MLVSVTMAVAIEESEPFRKVEIVADGGNYAPDVRKIRKEKIPAIGCISLKSAKRFLLFFGLANQAVNDYLLSLSSAGEFNPEIPDQEPPTFLDIQSLTKLYTGTGDLLSGNMINTLMRQSNVKLSPYVNFIQKQQLSNLEIFAMALSLGTRSKYPQLIIRLQALGPDFSRKISEWFLSLFKSMMLNLGDCSSVILCGIMTFVREYKEESFSQWSGDGASTVLFVQDTMKMICQQRVKSEFFQHPSTPSSCRQQLMNTSVTSKNFIGCFTEPIDSDGRIYAGNGDPPGQHCYYISSGHNRLEQYRLSTFKHFPVTCPISKKSLAKAGFYFTEFFDRVKCCACGRTVERWNDTDNPNDIKWHKPDCSFAHGQECGNIPIQSLFRTSEQSKTLAKEKVLQQRDATGEVVRTVRYPADLPERIRQTGGTFEIGPNNAMKIQAGPGRQNTGNVGGLAAQAPSPRRWRMANVISSDHRRFLTNLHLNRELDRLATFARWPVGRPNVSPAALARTGFFYLGDMDRTQCFSCGGVLRNWTLEDDAMAEHRSHFSNCKMVLGTEQRNYKVNEFPDPPADRAIDYPCIFPFNPHMRNEVARQETFDRRWPVGRTAATSAEISEAGFFFLGERDRVKCWYCNGGLQNWEYDDIPWIEHAKWFPTCQFLLQVKGQHFVYRYFTMNPHLARPIIAKQDGATVDPGNAGGGSNQGNVDIPPSGSVDRQSEPTPKIIDPQVEIRKRKERVKTTMEKSDLVKNILLMGFDKQIVAALLEEKIESGNVANPDDIYDSMSSLLDDVMKKEQEIKEEERQMQAAAQIAELSNKTEKERMCKICFSNPADMVFMPCGHMRCCMECTQAIRQCPVCHKNIEKAIESQSQETTITEPTMVLEEKPQSQNYAPAPSGDGNEENSPPEDDEDSPDEEEIAAAPEAFVPPDEPRGCDQRDNVRNPEPPDSDVIPPGENFQQPPSDPDPIPYEARLASLLYNLHFRNNLTPTPHEFARAGFYGEGNQITCAGFGLQHLLDHLVNRPSRNIVLHRDDCPFYNRRRPCGYCTPTGIGQHSLDECVQCGQQPEIMMAFSELEEYFPQDPEMPQEADIRAFADLQCVVCRHTIPHRQNQDVCRVCSGVICEDCVNAGAYHGH
ncbi:uncharacterized protein LOC120334150 isoform X2 [Styela clava]